MNIDQVTTAVKVGQFVINPNRNTKARLKVMWEDLGKEVLKDNAGRVYLMVVNGVIKKIGGSVSKGGIKSTMSFYESGNCGRPSIRSFGIQQLIFEELCMDNVVEIYIITSQRVLAPVQGLFGNEEIPISAFKEMEEKCIADFVKIEDNHPEWNYQEAGKPWEGYIQEAHAALLS